MPVSDAQVEAASKAVVAEWQTMLQEHRGIMSAAESARAFVSPGNYRLIKAALTAALADAQAPEATQQRQRAARLTRCVVMAMGCLDPNDDNPDVRLAWFRLVDAIDGNEPRASLAAPPATDAQAPEWQEERKRLTEDNDRLAAALDQLLDDMGDDNLCVCQAAKEMAIDALKAHQDTGR